MLAGLHTGHTQGGGHELTGSQHSLVWRLLPATCSSLSRSSEELSLFTQASDSARRSGRAEGVSRGVTVVFNQGPELGEGGSTPGREGTGGEKGSGARWTG